MSYPLHHQLRFSRIRHHHRRVQRSLLRQRRTVRGGRFGTFCINFWVGIAQLLLVGFFFLGWIWSIIWGYAFIALAAASSDRQVVSTTTTTMAASNVPQRLPTVY
ncbi:uncharacterized protein LOC143459924 isoform X1 [Clavelina lepadiformis]|uniref:uncharacterized protein LOC143459924 isoform X1 n=1 Tax=Clavelina lepadiformis TaxID=159417 RepID=UPI004042A642